MQRITTSSLFLVVLIGASLFALVRTAGVASDPMTSAASPKTLAVVRAYYLELQTFFETGDIDGIREMVAPVVFGSDDVSTGTGDLAFQLRGLRETYPALTFTVEETTGNGSTVIAEISVDSGQLSAVPVFPLTPAHTWRQIETFRVSAGRIVEWQSTGPLFGIFVSSPGSAQSLPLRFEHTLITARMTFTGGNSGPIALNAPALIIPERGGVLLQGNGVAIVFGSERPGGQVTMPGINVTVRPGESIVVPRGRAILSASSSMPASALVVLLAPARSRPTDRESHMQYPSPTQLLADQVGGQIGRGVWIAPLDSAKVSAHGKVELITGVARIESGNGMGIDSDIGSVLVLPQTGSISIQRDSLARRQMLVNVGHETVSAWIVGVRLVTVE